MLVKAYMLVSLYVFNSFGLIADGIGEVVICGEKAPTARFAYGEQFNPNLTLPEILNRTNKLSPDLHDHLQVELNFLFSRLKYTKARIKNTYPLNSIGCESAHVYQKIIDLDGVVFYLVDEIIFQNLTLSEQSLFLFEMALGVGSDYFEDPLLTNGLLNVQKTLLLSPEL